ncbi:MAG: CerR family C-terminal domain-containing protein [Sphingomonas sp.]|uniref:CerR family C-terminal domain-containing protein n=1 Tax=Sphingomonas sp. TaxID=28214 RepID=UPI0026123B01|nr:CerR family C-terminal domain-containing protein [Sphingomonas sp.]MDK2768109.1 CerR family C-terminal domain-containing protein [Sphingomonas sp.]
MLDAAIELFGQHGRDATTRLIAALADVNAPAVTYYFGSKEELYRACATDISEQIKAQLQPVLAEARSALDNRPSTGEIRAALVTILDAIVDMLFAPEAERWVLFVIREQVEPSEAFEIIYAAMLPVLQTLTALIGYLQKPATSHSEAALLAAGLYGQLVSYRLNRAALARLPGPSSLQASLPESIKALTQRQVEGLFPREG